MDTDELQDSLQAARLFLRQERADLFEAMLFASRATNYEQYARREEWSISVGLGTNEPTSDQVEQARETRRSWGGFKRGR